MKNIEIVEAFESQVRFYSRHFPVVFKSAKGCILRDTSNKKYIDFFSGAGALNYGHNDPVMQQAIVNHIKKNGYNYRY